MKFLYKHFFNLFFYVEKADISSLQNTIDSLKKVFFGEKNIAVLKEEEYNTFKKYIEDGIIFFCYQRFTKKRVGYCVIKKYKTRPETCTQVHPDYRNLGIATNTRNFAIRYAIADSEFNFDVIYSAANLWNTSSIISLLKSGYTITAVTSDDYVQLKKVL